MGATNFLMKTLPRVASEMALHVLAYNLTRVMNIIGASTAHGGNTSASSAIQKMKASPHQFRRPSVASPQPFYTTKTHLRHETRRDDECPTHLTCPLSRMLVWPLGILAD